MNGTILAVGVILACGIGPREDAGLGQAFVPGTGGTVLVIPPNAQVAIQQVPGPRGPVVRVRINGRAVQAPALRVSSRGQLFYLTAGPKNFNVFVVNPPRR